MEKAEERGRLRGVALELARAAELAKKRWPEDWGKIPKDAPKARGRRAGSAARR